jgi:hypothetical protein
MPEIDEMSVERVINDIITFNEGLRSFWTNADGWAPIEVSHILSKSRLDWQVSLSRCLKIWIPELHSENNNGQLILAWTNLGSLVEGTMKLYLSIWYHDYIQDIEAIKTKGNLVSPDNLQMVQMRQFFRKSIWMVGDPDWDSWILKIQQRRNAVHAYKNRDIGNFEEFFIDVRRYREFLRYINNRLPFPDDEIYKPREF